MANIESPGTIKDDEGYPKLSFEDKVSISAAIRNKQSFTVTAIRTRQNIAVKWLRKEISEQGMTSQTYTNNRWLVMFPLAPIFLAENIVRRPDYEIRRGFFIDFIEVTYRKDN